jgi:hypothetical protein
MKRARTDSLFGLIISTIINAHPCAKADAVPSLPADQYQGYSYVRGPTNPRSSGVWPGYVGLGTTLSRNIIFSDVVDGLTNWENWSGAPTSPHGRPDPRNYPKTHNHYQNLLTEAYNYVPYANGMTL